MRSLSPIFILPMLFAFGITFAQHTTASHILVGYRINPSTAVSKETNFEQNHRMFLAAVKATNLDKLIATNGKLTIFAPTDAAFEKISKATLKELMKPEHVKELRALLSYHIVADDFDASKILKALSKGSGVTTLTTVQGNQLTVSMRGINIILTDDLGNEAIITNADLLRDEGVVHAIDTVMKPCNMARF